MIRPFAISGPTEEQGTGVSDNLVSMAWLLSTVVFILALVLYVATMCRTVFWWDSGELAANASVLGIAHRPGFPLYILIGRLFGLTGVGEYFYRINFISALSGAVALSVLAHIGWQTSLQKLRHVRTNELIGISLIAAMAVGCTYSFWMQAVRAEVYAPTLVVIALMFSCAWQFDRSMRSGQDSGRWLCIAALIAGLGFGFHNATVASVLPAFALFFFFSGRRRGPGIHIWMTAVALFCLGLSVNLYLPIRAAQQPLLNWGWLPLAESSPGWQGIVGGDAWGTLLATAPADWLRRVWQSFQLLYMQWEMGLILFAIIGLAYWWQRHRRWCLLMLGIILGNVFMTAWLVTEFSDTNADIHGYLLPALAMFGQLLIGGLIVLSRGIRQLLDLTKTKRLRTMTYGVAVALVVFLGLAPLLIFGPYCNLGDHYLAYDFGTESTLELKPDAVVLLASTNWDFVLRGLQYCDNWRPDLRVLNRDLLPSEWYRHWADTRFPDLRIGDIPTHDRGLDLEQWALDLAGRGHAVYWEFTEINMDFVDHLLPAGHLYSVSVDSVPDLPIKLIREQEEFERRSRFFGATDRILYDYDAQMVFVSNLYRAGIYYESRGHFERARQLLRRALSLGQSEESDPMRRSKPRNSRFLGNIDSLLQLPPLDVANESD